MPLTAGSESTRTPAYAPVKERRGGGGQWRLKEGLPFPLPPTCSPDSLPSPPPPLLPSHLLPSSPPPRQLTLAGRLVGAVPLPSPPSSLPPPLLPSPPPSSAYLRLQDASSSTPCLPSPPIFFPAPPPPADLRFLDASFERFLDASPARFRGLDSRLPEEPPPASRPAGRLMGGFLITSFCWRQQIGWRGDGRSRRSR